jgi:hypothetical protein
LALLLRFSGKIIIAGSGRKYLNRLDDPIPFLEISHVGEAKQDNRDPQDAKMLQDVIEIPERQDVIEIPERQDVIEIPERQDVTSILS